MEEGPAEGTMEGVMPQTVRAGILSVGAVKS